MRACKNAAFRNGFSALLLRTDESARVYAPAERYYYCYYDYSSGPTEIAPRPRPSGD